MTNLILGVIALGGLTTVLEGCSQVADILSTLQPLLPA